MLVTAARLMQMKIVVPKGTLSYEKVCAALVVLNTDREELKRHPMLEAFDPETSSVDEVMDLPKGTLPGFLSLVHQFKTKFACFLSNYEQKAHMQILETKVRHPFTPTHPIFYNGSGLTFVLFVGL